MLKTLLLAAALCCAAITNAPAMAKAYGDDDSDTLVDLGKFKAVVIAGTTSADGRFALGWTINTLKKKLKPVDWSLWTADDGKTILDHYHLFDVNPSEDYEVDYLVIDLQARKTLALSQDFTTVRGSISAIWSDPVKGIRYGLLEFTYHYGTGITLVAIDAKGNMRTIETENMGKAVEAVLPPLKPSDFNGGIYITDFTVGDPGATFHGGYADITYESQVAKTEDEAGGSGIVTLRLADGKVMHVSADGSREDDPFQNNPVLKKADAGLNIVYRTLEKKLPAATRETLKKEQRAWIATRDEAAYQAANAAAASKRSDYTPAREKSLLDSTRKRTTELQFRLTAAH